MWAVERDPILRSTFLNITILDRAPDLDRLRGRMQDAIASFPRLRRRVRTAAAPWDRPRWIDDASFDIAFHVRRVALPPPGSHRQLLDLSALMLEDAFDPVRPLWQVTVVEGLEGGRAALLAKMHHTITDGVGGIRLSSSFLDLDREGQVPVRAAAPERPAEPNEPATGRSPLQTAAGLAGALRPQAVLRQTLESVELARSLARQGAVVGGRGSPLWTERSMGRRLYTIDLDLDLVRRAAKGLGGTINDLFVTGVAGGAAAYHGREGVPVREFRVSVPVSTRADASFGGNSFAPARVVVPADPDARPAERFRAVHQVLNRARGEKALGVADSLAAVLLALPPALLTPVARQQVSTVDFATSNLRGSPVELFVGGAAVLANYPMGPTAGVAFNATVLSYLDRLDLGLDVDAAAVADAEMLRGCIESSFAELFAAGA